MNSCDVSFLLSKASSPNFQAILAKCSESYSTIPFLDLYFGYLHRSTVVGLIVILTVIPLCFLLIKFNADKFLSTAITRVKDHFNISPLIASCTLIPLVNGAPDIICSITSGEQSEGIQISIGCLVGSFVFSAAVIVSVIVRKSQKQVIDVPEKTLAKEFVFYFVAILLILLYGLLEKINYVLACGFILLYVVYLVVTLKFNFASDMINEEQVLSEVESSELESQLSNAGNILDQQIRRKTTFRKICRMSKRVVLSPLKAACYLTVPGNSNPLMKSKLKFGVVFGSILFSICSFHFLNNWMMVGFATYSAFMVIAVLTHSKQTQSEQNLAFVFLTLCSSLAWVKLYCAALLDSIVFLSHLIRIDETFLSMVIVSVGNSLQDLFFNAALAQIGYEQMAIIATISSQILNIMVGLWLNFTISRKYDFNIFEFNEYGRDKTSGYLVSILLAFAALIIIINSTYLLVNNGKYKKNYSAIGFGTYAVFFGVSLSYVIYGSLNN
jgi:Ca2+/Na+ antiporter